jgi:hypothetical protein
VQHPANTTGSVSRLARPTDFELEFSYSGGVHVSLTNISTEIQRLDGVAAELAHRRYVCRDQQNSHSAYDDYVWSPAYFRMTGRQGLFAFQEGEALLMCCRHPNRDNVTLVFPEFSTDETFSLTRRVITTLLNDERAEVQFARFTTAQADALVGAVDSDVHGYSVCHVQEDALDWRFPCHTLDTMRVVSRQGTTSLGYGENFGMWTTVSLMSQSSTQRVDWMRFVTF